ncbi:hypothetical protein [Curtobacterium sp. MCBA15_009]|uniref:hypothetical protein n=1 Tax=Curtobacterium sp. MCBA15_009 TaxID=1898737 RepID=UPI0011137CCE|nr:hypothetical protein [Curtobacterium sp. MCBA15_009]
MDGNYGHRITAKALASRGLVRITGHGPSWKATLTDAGASRVAELKPSTTADAPGDAADDLKALRDRLEAGGGRLGLNDRDDDIDYPKLVWHFNKSEYRPHGKELHLSYPNWQDRKHPRLEYRDWFWDLVEKPEVQAIAPKSHLGTLAKTFLESKGDQFVTKESLPRAARIIESIVRHAAKAGITTRDPRAVDERTRRGGGSAREWSGHIELDVGEAVLRVQVREVGGRGGEKFDWSSGGSFDRKLYDQIQRLPQWQRNRNYWFVPTGKLELRVARPGFGFDGSKWGDTRTDQLEDRLGDVFQRLGVAQLEREAANSRARAAEEERDRDWAAAMTRAKALFRANQEEALLMEQASRWRRHHEITALVEELKRRSRDDGADAATVEWIALGERAARRLDPFEALAAPNYSNPTAENLEPYLDGWSAYGPRRAH